MKRLVLMLAIVLGVVGAASARGTYVHDDSVLPEAARNTIANNCKAKVSIVKIEKMINKITKYEVILTDGTEISFDKNGNWENVETNINKSVPSAFIPEAIAAYIGKNHKDTRIVGIEKERKGYEVELSNGIDLKFDADGKFLRYDD